MQDSRLGTGCHRVSAAFGKRIDETLLFAVAPVPASFPATAVVGVAGAAVSSALMRSKRSTRASPPSGRRGLIQDGVASSAAIGSALRRELRTIGGLPREAPSASVLASRSRSRPLGLGGGRAIVGDWSKARYRRPAGHPLRDERLGDPAGPVRRDHCERVQDDLVAMRVYLRMGAAIGRPVASDGTPSEPFSLIDWTTSTVAARRGAKGEGVRARSSSSAAGRGIELLGRSPNLRLATSKFGIEFTSSKRNTSGESQ